MKFDLHTHHRRCGHAEGDIEDYVRAGIEAGLKAIGISDHSPYFASDEDQLHPLIAMAKSDFPNYIDEVLRLKKKVRRNNRRAAWCGVRFFFPEHIQAYKDIYERYPFDYIIGSVHQTDGVSIFNKKRWNGLNEEQKVRQKEIYYDLIQQSAHSGMFQILGHIDAMKGFYPEFSDIQTDIVEKTLKVIADCDIAIEINTSGKTKNRWRLVSFPYHA